MSQPVPDTPASETAPRKRRFRMSKGRWIALVAVVVVIALGCGAFLLLRPQPTAQPQPRSRTFTVQKGTEVVAVGLTGTLSPQVQVNRSFPVPGTVTKVYVAAGDTVTKGQKLARIDDEDLQDALALAKANLETAEANLDDVSDSGTSAAITAARAQVKSARAAVASAEDDLDNAVLRSAIDGTIASVDLEVGDTVSGSGASGNSGGMGGSNSSSSSSAQFVIISTDAWKLDATVGSADLANLKAGQRATVTPDGATEPISGTVASVGIVATSSSDGSATFPVVVNLDGEHPELFSGTTATATVTIEEYPDVLTVPTMAITTADGKSVVTKVSGSTLEEVEVGIGRVFGETTEITSGLAEGDTVQITLTMPVPASGDRSDEGGFGGFGGMGGFGGPPGGGMPPGGGGAPPAGGGFPGGNR